MHANLTACWLVVWPLISDYKMLSPGTPCWLAPFPIPAFALALLELSKLDISALLQDYIQNHES